MPLKPDLTRPHKAMGAFRRFTDALSYRIPRPVTTLIQYSAPGSCYPLCPRCGQGMAREYIGFCDRCGQKLSWDGLEDAVIITAPAGD